jgi:SET domain-containing protein
MEQEIQSVMATLSAIYQKSVLPKQQAIAAQAEAQAQARAAATKKLRNMVVKPDGSLPTKPCCQ